MKHNKSPSPDMLLAEMFKAGRDLFVQKLCKLFNVILETSVFPPAWGKAIISTLYKGGDVNMPKNYRGISLLSVTCKLFTYILNARLVKVVPN